MGFRLVEVIETVWSTFPSTDPTWCSFPKIRAYNIAAPHQWDLSYRSLNFGVGRCYQWDRKERRGATRETREWRVGGSKGGDDKTRANGGDKRRRGHEIYKGKAGRGWPLMGLITRVNEILAWTRTESKGWWSFHLIRLDWMLLYAILARYKGVRVQLPDDNIMQRVAVITGLVGSAGFECWLYHFLSFFSL